MIRRMFGSMWISQHDSKSKTLLNMGEQGFGLFSTGVGIHGCKVFQTAFKSFMLEAPSNFRYQTSSILTALRRGNSDASLCPRK